MKDIYLKKNLWKLLVQAVQPSQSFLNDVRYFEAVFRLVEGYFCTAGTAVVDSWQKFRASVAASPDANNCIGNLKVAAADLMAEVTPEGIVVPVFFHPLAKNAIRHATVGSKQLIMDVLTWIVAILVCAESNSKI